MDKWEYKALNFDETIIAERDGTLNMNDCEQVLNELGVEGWEMINATVYGHRMRIFLKRRK